VQYPNFFETIKEARMRLESTIVAYEGVPYHCITVGDDDGQFFDLYLDPIERGKSMAVATFSDIPIHWFDEPGEPSKSEKMREWLEKRPESGVFTKKANDPGFNKFRPFSLGMVNTNGLCLYTERAPTRNMQQGLTQQMIRQWAFDPERSPHINYLSPEFKDMVIGDYPTPQECLDAVMDERCANVHAAFNRNFAFAEGDAGFLFLAYKRDIVGLLPHGDMSKLVLSTEYSYTKEVIDELELFETIDSK